MTWLSKTWEPSRDENQKKVLSWETLYAQSPEAHPDIAVHPLKGEVFLWGGIREDFTERKAVFDAGLPQWISFPSWPPFLEMNTKKGAEIVKRGVKIRIQGPLPYEVIPPANEEAYVFSHWFEILESAELTTRRTQIDFTKTELGYRCIRFLFLNKLKIKRKTKKRKWKAALALGGMIFHTKLENLKFVKEKTSKFHPNAKILAVRKIILGPKPKLVLLDDKKKS